MNEYMKRGKRKTCEWCKNEFYTHPSNPNSKRTKYCSPKCSQKASIRRNTENRKQLNLGRRLGLSGGKIGKINETVVAIDLLKKGWDVYTAFEDTHPFDILAIRENKVLKIEVKTANILPSGLRMITDPKKKLDKNNHDVLASVDNLRNIVYEPEI